MNDSIITNLGTCMPSVMNMLNGNISLLYYSHIPTVVISLFLGFFVLIKGNGKILSKTFFSLALVFAIWSILDLFTWLSTDTRVIMFTWSLMNTLESLFFILTFYFTYLFINKKDILPKYKIIWIIILLPIILTIPSIYNLSSFDMDYCYAQEHSFGLNYKYIVEIFTFISMVLYTLRKIKIADVIHKKQIIYLLVGNILFLLSFFLAVFLSGYLEDTGVVTGYGLEIYGLFGTTIFMVFIAYLIVRFKAFDIKLLGTQALVWALVILIGSQFFFIQSNINRVLTGITVLLSAFVGLMIVKSVKKEIKQKEKIENLADSLRSLNDRLEITNSSLELANERLKELDHMKSEFVSLATHQIRGPLAAIKGYVSLMIEGDYGKPPATFMEPLDTVFKSTDSLSKMVTDFLDVSRIDLGQMKYEFTDFDFRDLVEEVVKELRPGIELRGLEFREKLANKSCHIHADRTKLKQVLNNLIDNSSKYTEKGWLEVSVEKLKEGNKILFAVKDSGVGISKATLPVLFQRFSRAKNANDVNILGTGLGLYIAKKMVEANHGKIWAESAGEGKGAEFYVELNLVE